MTHPMIRHDAEEFAGVFYDKSRSKRFRALWPNAMEYVRANWPHFVIHVRQTYAEMLTRHDTTQAMKDAIYQALIEDAPGARSMHAEDPLPLAYNTQAFEGDRKENARTDETYGIGQGPGTLKSRILRTVAKFH